MKCIIILFTFLLFGCYGQREKQLNDLILNQSIELLQAKEIVASYTDIDNITRPFVIRSYVIDEEKTIKIVEPQDCMLETELKYRFKNVKSLTISDNTYWLPSRDYVSIRLLPNFTKNNTIKYSIKFDCDDFSKKFSVYAQEFYTKTVMNKNMESIAVCEIFYMKKIRPLNLRIGNTIVELPGYVRSRHAINCIVLDDLSLMFIEPQSGEEVSLSNDEIKSIYFCKF